MPVPMLDRITEDVKASMRAGEAVRLSTLRLLKSALQYKEIQNGKELTENDVLDVISAEVKRRRESVEEYGKAGRRDLADKESAELAVLTAYLPAQLSEAEVKSLVEGAVKAAGASTPKDMGKVMALLMPQVKGRADGKLVNQLVKSALGAN